MTVANRERTSCECDCADELARLRVDLATLSGGIILDPDRPDDTAGEPGLPTSRHGEPTDERPASTSSVEVVGCPAQRRGERVHANRREGRPSASPSVAPGRASSHDPTASSISASDAWG